MRTALVALLAAGLTSCSQDSPTTVLPPPPTAPTLSRASNADEDSDGSNAKQKVRPLKGQCETTFNAPSFPLPPVHHQTDVGTCLFKRYGQMALLGIQDINFAAGTQSGTRTLTAKNGDVLRATHTGTSAPAGPGLVRFSATATFIGGTGRFEGVTGQAHIEGVANMATRTSVSTWDGSLVYPKR